MPISPRKRVSARPRREAEIKLRTSAWLSSYGKKSHAWVPHVCRAASPLPKPLPFAPGPALASTRVASVPSPSSRATGDELARGLLAPPPQSIDEDNGQQLGAPRAGADDDHGRLLTPRRRQGTAASSRRNGGRPPQPPHLLAPPTQTKTTATSSHLLALW